MQLAFESSLDDALKCPLCGGFCLHHERVEIFERDQDAEKGLHVDILGEKLSVDKNLAGNPSTRRHGLKIHFYCEACPGKPVMSIYQHKGSTFIDFE